MNTRFITILLALRLAAGTAPLRAESNSTTAPRLNVKIILVGDSTVRDRVGWGAGFKQSLNDQAECINTTQGGRSSMSFMKEGRWINALALRGDYYLIQFGHNNEPGKPGRSTDMATYISDLTRCVDETRATGAKRALVTPLVRCQWDMANPGKIKSTLAAYAEEVKKLAAAKQVPTRGLARAQPGTLRIPRPGKVPGVQPAEDG